MFNLKKNDCNHKYEDHVPALSSPLKIVVVQIIMIITKAPNNK